MRFTHHAKNRLRKLKATQQEAEAVVEDPSGKDFDVRGNPRYLGFVAGTPVRVVVAGDDLNLVITIYERGRA